MSRRPPSSQYVTALVAVSTVVLLVAPVVYGQLALNVSRLLMVRGMLSSPSWLGPARDIAQPLLRGRHAVEAQWILCRVALVTGEAPNALDSCGMAGRTVREIVLAADSVARRLPPDRAAAIYEVVRDLHPSSALVYHRLGKVYSPGKEQAVAAFREAIRLTEAGDDTLAEWDLIDAHLQLARNYIWWEAYDLALSEAQASIALAPELNAQGYRLQGIAYAYANRLDLADRSMAKAVQLDQSFWPYLDWGDIWRIGRRPALAAEKYRESIRRADGASKALGYERLCRLFLEVGDGCSALPACDMLVAESGEQCGPLLMLGDAYRLVGDLGQAAATYYRVLSIDPLNADALDRLGLSKKDAR